MSSDLEARLISMIEGEQCFHSIKNWPKPIAPVVSQITLAYGHRRLVVFDAWTDQEILDPRVLLIGYDERNLEQIAFALNELRREVMNWKEPILACDKIPFSCLGRHAGNAVNDSTTEKDRAEARAGRLLPWERFVKMIRAQREMGMADPELTALIGSSAERLGEWFRAIDAKVDAMAQSMVKFAAKGRVVQVLHNRYLFGTGVVKELQKLRLPYLAAASKM